MKRLLIGMTSVVIIALIGASAFVLIVANTPDPTTAQATVAQTQVTPPTADEMLKLVNAERAKIGVTPLTIDPLLNKSAQMKADDMQKGQYGHINTDGRHGYMYISDTGKKCVWQGENINAAQSSNESVEEWVNSPEHYKAMVDSRYEQTGFGISLQGKYYYTVQHFCDVN
jgi:uncharacterized protein YkwD